MSHPVKQPFPKDIQLRPDGIHIQWDDGHQSYYDHRHLRYQCGCAQCVNEMTGQRMIVLANVPMGVEALDWIQVGQYAIQFLWSDAHTTGIYPFVLLRELCRCDQCRETSPQRPE